MAVDAGVLVRSEADGRDDPRLWYLVGMLATVIPLVCVLFVPSIARTAYGLPICLLSLVVGAIAAGAGVAIRPMSWPHLLLAALIAFIGSWGFAAFEWDSARMLMVVLTIIAAVAAFLMALPRPARRIGMSILIVLHFLGILTAVTSAPPGVWLSHQLWGRVYYPYLQFMYLNNAYHFYAPEPGPASLLWFCVEYERNLDGSKNWRWIKVPDLDAQGKPVRPDGEPLRPYVEYTRRLSLVENASFPPNDMPQGAAFQLLWERRVVAGEARGIPVHPEALPQMQYRPLGDLSKLWLSSYVRHVAHTFRCPTHPELRITGIKVYRAIHNLLMPLPLSQGIKPHDPILFWAYYEGEYDADGVLKPYAAVSPTPASDSPLGRVSRADHGEMNPETGGVDPFVGWLIPILRQPAYPNQPLLEAPVKNYVYVHANVEDRGELP